MSSSDDDSAPEVEKKFDKALFVKIVAKNKVVLNKSKVPFVITSKKEAWRAITVKYNSASGHELSSSQLSKMLNNMKTRIKKKIDLKATGNKPIKLKDWEKQFLEILDNDDSPVFCKVPGSVVVGINETTTAMDVCDDKAGTSQGNSNQTPAKQRMDISEKIRRSSKKVLEYESEFTKDLSTPQLQRIVLLQQMKINEMKIEREKIKLAEVKKAFSDQSTQTNDADCGYITVFEKL